MIFLKWSFLNLYRNKRRSWTTGLALVFGFTGMLVLSGYIMAIEKAVRAQTIYLNHVGNFSIYKKEAVKEMFRDPQKYLLSKQDQELIAKTLNEFQNKIEFVAPILSSFALLSSGDKNLPLFIQAYPKGFSAYIANHKELKENLPTLQSQLIVSDGVSLTSNLYNMLGYTFPLKEKIEVQILGKTLDGYFNGVTDELTGKHLTGMVFSEDISAKMSLEKLQELMATDKVNNLAVFLKDVDETQSLIKTILSELPKGKYEIFAYDSDEIGFYYTGTMSFVMSIGIFFYVLITLASVLSIINTLTMSINERTKEIGTLRSIGFTATHISRLFTLEVLVLTFGSIVVSSICYLIVSNIINSLEIPFEPAGSSSYVYFTIVTSFKIALIHAVVLILITFITSYLSCKKKMNFKISELLNEQGVFK